MHACVHKCFVQYDSGISLRMPGSISIYGHVTRGRYPADWWAQGLGAPRLRRILPLLQDDPSLSELVISQYRRRIRLSSYKAVQHAQTMPVKHKASTFATASVLQKYMHHRIHIDSITDRTWAQSIRLRCSLPKAISRQSLTDVEFQYILRYLFHLEFYCKIH